MAGMGQKFQTNKPLMGDWAHWWTWLIFRPRGVALSELKQTQVPSDLCPGGCCLERQRRGLWTCGGWQENVGGGEAERKSSFLQAFWLF